MDAASSLSCVNLKAPKLLPQLKLGDKKMCLYWPHLGTIKNIAILKAFANITSKSFPSALIFNSTVFIWGKKKRSIPLFTLPVVQALLKCLWPWTPVAYQIMVTNQNLTVTQHKETQFSCHFNQPVLGDSARCSFLLRLTSLFPSVWSRCFGEDTCITIPSIEAVVMVLQPSEPRITISGVERLSQSASDFRAAGGISLFQDLHIISTVTRADTAPRHTGRTFTHTHNSWE